MLHLIIDSDWHASIHLEYKQLQSKFVFPRICMLISKYQHKTCIVWEILIHRTWKYSLDTSMYFLPRIYSYNKIVHYLFQKLMHINLLTIGRFGHMLKTYFLDLHSSWEPTWRSIGPIGLLFIVCLSAVWIYIFIYNKNIWFILFVMS